MFWLSCEGFTEHDFHLRNYLQTVTVYTCVMIQTGCQGDVWLHDKNSGKHTRNNYRFYNCT